MSWWVVTVLALLAWFVVGLATAPVIGRRLRAMQPPGDEEA